MGFSGIHKTQFNSAVYKKQYQTNKIGFVFPIPEYYAVDYSIS
jgi:hypothetical protein